MTTELDRLLEHEEEPDPQKTPLAYQRVKGRNLLKERIRPEVEALQARVRELEAEITRTLEQRPYEHIPADAFDGEREPCFFCGVEAWKGFHQNVCPWFRLPATLEGKD